MTTDSSLHICITLLSMHFLLGTNSECIYSPYHQLLPTQLPQELKSLLHHNKQSDYYVLVQLIVKSLLLKCRISKTCAKSVFQYFYFNKYHLERLLNVFYQVDVSLFVRRKTVFTEGHKPIHVKQFPAKTYLVSLNPTDLLYMQTMNSKLGDQFHHKVFLFHVQIPQRYHVNMTFQSVSRPRYCPFHSYVWIKHRLRLHQTKLQYYFEVFFQQVHNFIPWSLVLENHMHGVFIHLEPTLLYPQEHDCPKYLFIVMFQPIMSFYFSHNLPPTLSPKISDTDPCFFKTVSLATSRDFPPKQTDDKFVYTLRVTVVATQFVVLMKTEWINTYFSHQTNQQYAIHLQKGVLIAYDGPGVLSPKLEPSPYFHRTLYQASTFQMFLVCSLATSVVHNLIDRSWGQFWYHGLKIDMNYKKASKQVNELIFDESVKEYSCKLQSQAFACHLRLTSEENINIEITSFQGLNSISSHELTSSKNIGTDIGGQSALYGPCYFGLIALGVFSMNTSRKSTYDMLPMCTVHLAGNQSIWLSSAYILDVLLYSYKPYSNLKAKFQVSESLCTPVLVKMCTSEMFTFSSIAKILHDAVVIKQNNMNGFSHRNTCSCLTLHITKLAARQCKKKEIMNINLFSLGHSELLDITSDGFAFIHHIQHHPTNGPSVRTASSTFHFNGKMELHNFSDYGQFSFVLIDMGERTTIFALLVVLHVTGCNSGKQVVSGLPTRLAENLTTLLTDNTRKCYTLSFEKTVQITSVIKLEKTIFRKAESPKRSYPRRSYTKKNEICYYKDPLGIGRQDSCRNTGSLFSWGGASLVKQERLFSELTKIVEVKDSLYIDTDIEHQIWYDQEMGGFTTEIRKGVMTVSVPSLSQIKNAEGQGGVHMLIKQQSTEKCYTHPTNVFLPTTALPRHFLLLSSVKHQQSLYKLFMKMFDSDAIRPLNKHLRQHRSGHTYVPHSCFFSSEKYCEKTKFWHHFACNDMITCNLLIPGETELVTWNEAEDFCADRNMTLVTIGSKEEELVAFSLQTVSSADGKRYKMQPIYLGLKYKVCLSIIGVCNVQNCSETNNAFLPRCPLWVYWVFAGRIILGQPDESTSSHQEGQDVPVQTKFN